METTRVPSDSLPEPEAAGEERPKRVWGELLQKVFRRGPSPAKRTQKRKMNSLSSNRIFAAGSWARSQRLSEMLKLICI